jgi:outer membrane receptor for ferrienterochelin and colicins
MLHSYVKWRMNRMVSDARPQLYRSTLKLAGLLLLSLWASRAPAQDLARGAADSAASTPRVAVSTTGTVVGTIQSDTRTVGGALIEVAGTTQRARSDSIGAFRLLGVAPGVRQVRIRAFGFAPVTRVVTVAAGIATRLDVVLVPSVSTLATVVTTGTLKDTYVSDAPVKVDVVTPAFLQRNVGATVMDNVSFLPGLAQQVDCGVCFTNNIRVNGMEGPYTAVLIDGAPMVSALATVYGLNSIDPSLIEQIEIIKGPNSTLYGSEAMGGVINIVTKDARLAPRLALNAFGTSNGETNLALGAARSVGSARTLLSVNGAWNEHFVDQNGDGFRDLPSVKRISLLNKWAVGPAANRPLDLLARYYYEDRAGGVGDWTSADRGSSSVYGESIRTSRAELLGTYRMGQSIAPVRVDVSLNWHHQDSFYGSQAYLATQTVAFAQGVWSPQVGRHAFMLGGTLRHQTYHDSTQATRTSDARFVPGVFAQDEISLGPSVALVGGLRLDRHRAHGVIPSPRVALKWTPDVHTTVRANAATGFRVVSLFTEDHAALTGARTVRIAEALQPERSGTVTLGVNRVFDVRGIEDAMTLDVDAFFTRFRNRIVGNFERDPDLIVYENLDGSAETRGVSVALGYATLRQPFFGNVGVTLQHASLTDAGRRRDLVFSPRVQTVFTIGYRIDQAQLTLDWTGRVQGPTPLPSFAGLPSVSPWFTEQHVQITRQLQRGSAIYVAVKNLFNYSQRDAIIDPGNPFGDRFDTARVFGPIQGRRVLVGVRQTVSR